MLKMPSKIFLELQLDSYDENMWSCNDQDLAPFIGVISQYGTTVIGYAVVASLPHICWGEVK